MDIAIFLFASLWLIAVTMRIWLYAKTHLWVLTTAHELSLIQHIVTLRGGRSRQENGGPLAGEIPRYLTRDFP